MIDVPARPGRVLLLSCLLLSLPGLLVGGRDDGEAVIAYFGPDDPADPDRGEAWVAATLAIEQANREAGPGGPRFRLASAWSVDPWGTGITRLVRRVYAEQALAVLVPTDGSAVHLAEQVAAKARIPLVASGSTDKTVNLAHVPWVFSCPPPDDRVAELLADRIVDETGGRPFTVLSGVDHDSHRAAHELLGALARRESVPERHLEFDAGDLPEEEFVRSALEPGAASIVILADAARSARWVRALRNARDDLTIYGGATMGRRAFVAVAGSAAEGVRFPSTCVPPAPTSAFARDFQQRTGALPDCLAAETHQAARLLVAAIREAGPARAPIRDAIAGLSGQSGSAGILEWNELGQNLRAVRPATIRGGRVVLLSP